MRPSHECDSSLVDRQFIADLSFEAQMNEHLTEYICATRVDFILRDGKLSYSFDASGELKMSTE